ncbi:MAG: pyruvate, phosphate dikinase [Rickettsia sp.]|nr:pyruvate, phosphate dikinase [Rickettsia sp.]
MENRKKFFYKFSSNLVEGNSRMVNLLGNKGANLSEMSLMKIPVPPGFIISADLCNLYKKDLNFFNLELDKNLAKHINWLEEITNKSFGKISQDILLVSVRSGASVSMPGMMSSILNIGVNDEILEFLIKKFGYEFAYDIYRRFLLYYGHNVFSIALENFPKENFQKLSIQKKKDLLFLLKENKLVIESQGYKIEQNPYIQLRNSIIAVIKSWNSPAAQQYRDIHNISNLLGTAVNVQMMVYGNISNNSGSGVFFTRSPLNGEKKIYGEFLLQSQGEDIVSGKFTPIKISDNKDSLQQNMPFIFSDLVKISDILENYFNDMQDVEFTIENGKLYILQTRRAKRNSFSDVKILHDFALEQKISKKEAIKRFDISQISKLFFNVIKDNDSEKLISHAIGGSFGAITGILVFSLQEIEKYSKFGNVILVKQDIGAEDHKVISMSDAVLSLNGGATSHAAVITRAMGKIFLCGVNDLSFNKERNCLIGKNNLVIKSGEYLTLDGYEGKIFLGKLELIQSSVPEEFFKILSWAKKYCKISLRVNADSKKDLKQAIKYGVKSIGLCRTEHMFFSEEKIFALSQMILADSSNMRKMVLEKLVILHQQDFLEIFSLLENNVINIRLLDMPLHEFLPNNVSYIENLAEKMSLSVEELNRKILSLSEVNPMLGHRGIRLAITYPEIYLMQIKAIFSAVEFLYVEQKKKIHLEIMVPFISDYKEILFFTNLVKNYINSLKTTYHLSLKLGCMIELPRAALTSEQIAPYVDFISFGTNDLTQTIWGLSRDDVGKFFDSYKKQEIFSKDYFTTLDIEAVGQIMQISVKKIRSVNKDVKIGVCGEHASDPLSIKFFANLGVDYISCSPYRLHYAQIAASQVDICQNL